MRDVNKKCCYPTGLTRGRGYIRIERNILRPNLSCKSSSSLTYYGFRQCFGATLMSCLFNAQEGQFNGLPTTMCQNQRRVAGSVGDLLCH